MPVEIWSRYMRAAHQGVAPVGLPGLVGGAPVAAAPLPPANIAGPVAANSHAPQGEKPGLDSWLLDRLFVRR